MSMEIMNPEIRHNPSNMFCFFVDFPGYLVEHDDQTELLVISYLIEFKFSNRLEGVVTA